MKNLIHEVHRRSLWQVLGIYLGASWLILQVVDTLAGALSLPDWSASLALFLLIIGLPIVLTTAFIQGGAFKRADRTGSPSATERGAPSATSFGVDSVGPGTTGRHLFTWRNAILGGVGAFALLGVLSAGWLGSRTLGIGPAATLQARGVIEEQALVILADFESDEEALGEAATEALRVDLGQSDVIRLADPGQISDAKERMGLDVTAPMTMDVVSEIAVREGAGAVVTGEINRAGSGYVFSASLIDVADGTVLTSQRESVSGDDDVVPAIDRLSKKLRERIGESYRSIRSDPPLARVTTSSLEALELFSRARRAPFRDQITLLEQAVELDSTFAMAWRLLGIRYNNANVERARSIRAFTRAFEERDRLTPYERHQAASVYYTVVDFDPAMASVEYQAILELDPDNVSTMINLGVMRSELGDHEGSSRFALQALEANPRAGNAYWNGVTSLVNLGRIDEARALADSSDRTFGNRNPRLRLMVDQAAGPLADAEAAFRDGINEDIPAQFRARLALTYAAFAAAQGRLEEAEAETRTRTTQLLEDDDPAEYLETEIQAAWTDLGVRGRPDLAVARLDQAFARAPLGDMEVLDRPYLELAEILARAGEPGRARALVDEMRAEVRGPLSRVRQQLRQVEGEIALAEGRPEEAIERFEGAFEQFCHICPLPGLALAYEAAGRADEALEAHRRYAETPFSDRFLPYEYRMGQTLGPTYERLGELHDRRGDMEDAARFYAAFVELWADADTELQPRVQAAQSRLEAILQEIG